jgi:hypothetical protein
LKRLSLYFALVLFVSVFTSCSNSSNPTAQFTQDEPAISAPTAHVTLLQLPDHATPVSLKKTSKAVLITPEDGGDVNVTDTYISTGGKTVSIAMTLHFKPGTVDKATEISITLDTQMLMAEFSPSGIQFKQPAMLSATVSGLDLSALPTDAKVDLFYINGMSFEKMSGTVTPDPQSGTLVLAGGAIPHFSLYGFGYTK